MAESADERVSTSALSPVTVIDSAVVPTERTKFSPASWPTCNVMPACTPVLNPCRLARASYLPGASPGTVKYPLESVTALRVTPVSRFEMTRSTPGSTPPVSSLMVPERVADVICATARDALAARRTTPRATFSLMSASLSSYEVRHTINDVGRENQSIRFVVDGRVGHLLAPGIPPFRDRRQRPAVSRDRHARNRGDARVQLRHDFIRAWARLPVRVRHVLVCSLDEVVVAVEAAVPFEVLDAAARIDKIVRE